MERYEIINAIIKKYGYKTYLEIGTQFGQGYKFIECDSKECIDIEKKYDDLTYHMSSDDFFAQNKKTYDIIFVDGLHLEHQVTTDVLNSLKILTPGGTIMCHDCLPPYEGFTELQHSGTCYKSIVELRCTRNDLRIATVNTDCGCSIIRVGESTPYTAAPANIAKEYQYWYDHQNEIMNIISVDQFKQLIG
jgi:predicted O-methyltransferase YrrM